MAASGAARPRAAAAARRSSSPAPAQKTALGSPVSGDTRGGHGNTPGHVREHGNTPGHARGHGNTPGHVRGQGNTPGHVREHGNTPGHARGQGNTPGHACDRPEASRRSPRLRAQKENVPASPGGPAPPRLPASPRASPLSPARPAVAPRVRRSYSRLEASTPLGRALAPRRPAAAPCPPLSPVAVVTSAAATDLPGIGLGPERRRKRKVAPIDQGELEAWAARMNAQFEEAERFDLVVE